VLFQSRASIVENRFILSSVFGQSLVQAGVDQASAGQILKLSEGNLHTRWSADKVTISSGSVIAGVSLNNDWVTQGSLSQSRQGNWRWTRKVKAKTVTVALSDPQAELFRRAIDL
jgi:hypothetical protein